MAALAFSFQPASSAGLIGANFWGRFHNGQGRNDDDGERQDASRPPYVGPQEAADSNRARNGAFKTKWKSFVHFFALPIRQYYQQPPGLSYRQRAARRDPRRRGSLVLDSDDFDSISVWACPTYNCEVGDDEMVLFKSAEARQEARDAIAAATATLHYQPSTSSWTARPTLHTHTSTPTAEQSESGIVATFEQSGAGPPPGEAASAADVAEEMMMSAPRASEEAAPDYELLASPTPFPAVASDDLPSTSSVTASMFPLLEDANASEISLASTPSARPRAYHRSLSSFTDLAEGERPRLRSKLRPSFLRRPSQSSAVAQSTSAGAPLGGGPAPAVPEPFNAMLLRGPYPLPKRGLTAQQMSFLSSVESLGRYGLATPLEGSPMIATPAGASTPPYAPPRSSRPRTAPQPDYFSQMTSSVTR